MNHTPKKRSVAVNALLNVIKQIFSIIFPMITFPYAARVLGAAGYGKYTFSTSIVSYISYLAAAGIATYAIRECARIRDDEEELRRLVNELYTINLLTTGFALAVLGLLLAFVPMLKDYRGIILILSLSIPATTLGTDWINSAFEDYFFIAVRYIISYLLAMIMLFVFVRKPEDLPQYALISIMGMLLTNLMNFVHIRRTLGIRPRPVLTETLTVHIRPILYLFASVLTTYIYINSDITILGIFRDDTVVGYYGVATRFYTLVKYTITAAFAVLLPRLSNELAYSAEKVYARYGRILALTLLMIAPCSAGLFMVRKSLILVFAGSAYTPAASPLAILSVSLLPALLANFFINIVMIPQKKEREVMIATSISAVLNIALNFVLIPLYGANAAAFTTLLAEFAMTLLSVYYCRDIRILGIRQPLVTALAGIAAIAAVCSGVHRLAGNALADLLGCVAAGGAAYAIVLSLTYRAECAALMKRLIRRR